MRYLANINGCITLESVIKGLSDMSISNILSEAIIPCLLRYYVFYFIIVEILDTYLKTKRFLSNQILKPISDSRKIQIIFANNIYVVSYFYTVKIAS